MIFNAYTFDILLLMTPQIKSLPGIQETQVRSLGQEDLLEKEMATHSSILSEEWPEVVYCPRGCKDADMTEQLRTHLPLTVFTFSFPEVELCGI